MLIRIMNDPRAGNMVDGDGKPIRNHELIDKLIAVKGLPKNFYVRPHGIYECLRPGIEMDVPENMPEDILEVYSEPFEVDVVYPPMEKGEKHWAEKVRVKCIRIDVQTNEGNAITAELERMIAKKTPVNETPIKADMVGDRQGFRMTLEQVPFVDLEAGQEVAAKPVPPAPKPAAKSGYCETCNKTFMNRKALTMHNMRSHKKEVVHG